MESDEVLIGRVAAGDPEALRLLYARHAAVMLRLLRRMTSDTSLAEELLQEAWLAVWQSAGSYRAQASVRSWLLGVTRRQAHNRLRRREPVTVEVDAAGEVVDGTVEVEAEVLGRAGHAELMAAIRGLPEHLREVVMLAWVEDLPYRDVANVLGVPTGTVKSRVAHARARLAATVTRSPVA